MPNGPVTPQELVFNPGDVSVAQMTAMESGGVAGGIGAALGALNAQSVGNGQSAGPKTR